MLRTIIERLGLARRSPNPPSIHISTNIQASSMLASMHKLCLLLATKLFLFYLFIYFCRCWLVTGFPFIFATVSLICPIISGHFHRYIIILLVMIFHSQLSCRCDDIYSKQIKSLQVYIIFVNVLILMHACPANTFVDRLFICKSRLINR